MTENETFCLDIPELNHRELMNELGLVTGVKWDTYAFIKGGANQGVNQGAVTGACFQQIKKADLVIAKVMGLDAGILAPGFYSKEKVQIILFIIEIKDASYSKIYRI